ncbi:PLP-dependent aspartate aminotransferase family protein [Nocardia sp. NEAU-G5]|uniref:PLP-dependent aspartate aminotransferase family protein n=1 Tax=Nocardia albiluteola TaxID=2842303 RepID=A0ABS6B545_9NOCA|nr:PLP-dependent aspartate aminotransferase family protein [Nocardia albiluteola]MBU3065433.1 PLP-dependent aspartate aminotransferase family protein [Nocardia albiluteola]
MDIETLLVHAARQTAAAAHSVSVPLVRTSTTVFDSFDAYKRAQSGLVFDSPRYGRSGTSTTFELQRAMAQFANTESCIATSSGLAAITAALTVHSGPGCHILVSAGVYGPTRVFCDEVLIPSGTDVEYFAHDADVSSLLRDTTSLVFVETPASLTMEMWDVPAICAAAHDRGVPVACDSTWGTPIFFDAHALGIDISIHAATKFINGHSDLLLGLVTGTLDALADVRTYCDRSGTHAAPDTCWLTLRGLRTLAVRMERHERSALAVAQWLQSQPGVQRVLFPALDTDPGYELWRSQFSGAAGPFTIELAPCSEDAFTRFIDHLSLFSLGSSWGGFESLVMPAVPHHLRALATSADTPRLVRFHIGLESPPDLCGDLAAALSAMRRNRDATAGALRQEAPVLDIRKPQLIRRIGGESR